MALVEVFMLAFVIGIGLVLAVILGVMAMGND